MLNISFSELSGLVGYSFLFAFSWWAMACFFLCFLAFLLPSVTLALLLAKQSLSDCYKIRKQKIEKKKFFGVTVPLTLFLSTFPKYRKFSVTLLCKLEFQLC